jgi:TolA-binding protein
LKEVISLSPRKLSKKEIREDTFITTTLRAWDYIREHQNQFFAGLVIVIVLIAAVTWFSHSRSERGEAAATQFAEALQLYRAGNVSDAENAFNAVHEMHPSSREGVYALYLMGKCALEDGRNIAAITMFDEYLQHSRKFPFFRDAALDGKACALENMQKYGEAADIYLDLAENTKASHFNETVYLRKAADNLKLSNQKDKAIEVLQKLMEKSAGIDRRNIEIEIAILRS